MTPVIQAVSEELSIKSFISCIAWMKKKGIIISWWMPLTEDCLCWTTTGEGDFL
jgi:hypothetical protein